ncbi:ThuA domain-containing protein [Aquimarina pacifica]|uniref:ThuA domain-containing protein n=1 Tax=Aquimarina pacifica TaxID=1296415 RepID=UPI000471F1CF|nr:ThuA domain-containing protein [Aquimarina pacifica]
MKKLLKGINNKKILLIGIFFFSLQLILANDFKVLVFHKTNGYRHSDAITESIQMLEELGTSTAYDNWTVDETQDPSVFTTDNLSQYEVIIFSNTTGGGLLDDNQKSAMETFIQSGKGFIGFHSATDTYRNDSADASWPWYNELVGAIVQTSPNHTSNNLQGTMNILTNHVTTSHIGDIGDTWQHNEEWYYWEQNGGQLSNNNTVLLEVQSTGSASYDATRPITWLKEYDGGRSFYTALGHNGETYASNQTFRQMIQKAVLWVSNRLSVDNDCSTLTPDWTDLLANDFDCWEKWMGVPHTTTGLPGSSDNVTNGSGTALGLNNDPTNVFSIIDVDGEKQLYITGEVYGGLTTINTYGNYHLSMQFKWGEQKWEPRLDRLRDSGILYHCQGEHGSFWDVWKSSLEFQVQEGDCGDYIGLAGVKGLIPAEQVGNNLVFTPMAPLQSNNIIRKSEDFEYPNGEWNTLEVIVIGDRAIHYVNGNMVNALVDATWDGITVTEGQIQIQSEGAEMYYRDIKIKSITSFPDEDLETLGWDDTVSIICDTNAPIGEIIALKKSGGDEKWVTIDPSTTNLVANGEELERELFLVESHSDNGCVALKSVSTGKYLQVNGGNTSVEIKAKGNAPGTWENFGWNEIGENQVALKSLFNSGWIQADWTQDNTSLFPLGLAVGSWETFDYVIINDASSCTEDAPIGEIIALKKSGGDQKWITIESSTTNLIANGEEGERALFLVESHSDDGCIALKSVETGKYLQVNGGNTGVEIRAKGNAPGTWENFSWESMGEGQVAMQSLFNDGWIQANWSTSDASLYPLGTAAGSSETFDYVIIEDLADCKIDAPIGEIIALKKSGGDQKWITIESSTTNLIADGEESERALFLVESHSDDGCVAFKSVTTGKYLQVNGGNTDVEIRAKGNAPGTWENFSWESMGDGQVAIQSLFNDGWIQANWSISNASLYPFGAAAGRWETFDYVIVPNTLSSRNEIVNTGNLLMYPNPASKVLKIEGFLDVDIIQVYDMFGRVLFTEDTTDKQEITIDTSDFPVGAYIINTGQESKVFVKN